LEKTMLEQTITTLTSLPNQYIYLLLFINAFIEYIFPPVPGDTIMVFGAYLVGIKKLNFTIVYLVSTAGSISGFLTLFSLGKYLGRDYFFRKDFRFFSREMILRVEQWFHRYGIGLIAANRFFSGIRSAIAVFAGIARMKFLITALAALLSSMVWNALLISGGYFLGKNWQLVLTILKRYNQGIVIVILLSLLLYYLWKKKQKRKNDR
jgi:membrane protein DedA with SNARE-associated domain